jgi:hypothetical protein
MSIHDLGNFTGTENWYRHMSQRVYTDGIKYLAEDQNCYWLIDEVLFAQTRTKIKAEPFQVWTLKTKDETGLLTCNDGNGNIVFKKKIPYTDFSQKEIKLYFCDSVLMLPSEY